MFGPEKYNKNNLSGANSPYLKQHSENPVHWQEWSPDVLAFAKNTGKKIFVSVGYSTCHWCHVMASEAFSDETAALYLNEHYVSVKVDREQRPDIDQYFMAFMTASTGRGGWPLNVILTSDAKPVIAFTYLPVKRKRGLPAFIELLQAVNERGVAVTFNPDEADYNEDGGSIHQVVESLLSAHDYINGGFGNGAKFPPACVLLMLMSYYDRYRIPEVKDSVIQTLDVMMDRGLHDHLQGGFFRYCVDTEWTIPHFEKMLYDQAMLLWTYSWALKVFSLERYNGVIQGIIDCLDNTFIEDGLYISAHDADTEHIEGTTYLWCIDELEDILEPDEFSSLLESYYITAEGNFEGKNHLIRINPGERGVLEKKLLEARRGRVQPFADRKIITSWNAYTGIGLIMAWRATGDRSLLDRAVNLMERIIEKHHDCGRFAHSSLGEAVQENEFLEDAASMLLFATYIHEETRDIEELMKIFADSVMKYYDGVWYESDNSDFKKVKAGFYDHPVPSSVSSAAMALLRYSLLTKKDFSLTGSQYSPGREFHNLALFIADDNWHLIHSPQMIKWTKLPLNSIQIPDEQYSDCFDGACRMDVTSYS